MPYQATFFQLPCGLRGCELELTGVVSGEDVAVLIQQLDPGSLLSGLPFLVLTENMASISSDARAVIAARGGLGDREPWVAAVVSNPVVRVAVNFIVRIQRSKKLKLFAGKAEALQWLDARAREGLAAKTGAS